MRIIEITEKGAGYDGAPYERKRYKIEVPSGKFEITESRDGGLRIEVGGPSNIVVMGGNVHSTWQLSGDKAVVLYRRTKGEIKYGDAPYSEVVFEHEERGEDES
jgi:hypothetical protein